MRAHLPIFVFALASCTAAYGQVEPPPDVLQAEAARIQVMHRASQATIAVFQAGGQGGGSGVVISADGLALTNFHVTSMSPALECGMADGNVYDAVLVGVDPTGDVAMIKLFGKDDFPFAPTGDSDRVQAGQWVFAAGNPFLLAEDFRPTLSYGIVSGVHRYQYPAGTLLEYADCIQTDAAINPGNSGGPLFNRQGEVIGINGRGSFEKRGRVNVGVGYAISINQIKKFEGYLKSGRIVDHATLGATVTTDEQDRVVVDDIDPASDAYRRGLRYDDEIVHFAGRDIHTVNGFKNILGTLPKGWRVPLTFRRDGTTYEVLVRLSGVHGDAELIERIQRQRQRAPDEQPRRPDDPNPPMPPSPIPGMLQSKPKLPAIVEKHYEARRGFANYYFNRMRLEAIFRDWPSADDENNKLQSAWHVSGETIAGGEFKLLLSADHGRVILPHGQFEARLDWGDAASIQLSPPNSGGLLQALSVYKRLLSVGPEKFGELTYLGSMPMSGDERPWADVVIGMYGGVETRFYFDPDSRQMLRLEYFGDVDIDPCEIVFADYRTADGIELPHRWEVRHGDAVFGVYQVQEIQFVSDSGGDADSNTSSQPDAPDKS